MRVNLPKPGFKIISTEKLLGSCDLENFKGRALQSFGAAYVKERLPSVALDNGFGYLLRSITNAVR